MSTMDIKVVVAMVMVVTLRVGGRNQLAGVGGRSCIGGRI